MIQSMDNRNGAARMLPPPSLHLKLSLSDALGDDCPREQCACMRKDGMYQKTARAAAFYWAFLPRRTWLLREFLPVFERDSRARSSVPHPPWRGLA